MNMNRSHIKIKTLGKQHSTIQEETGTPNKSKSYDIPKSHDPIMHDKS